MASAVESEKPWFLKSSYPVLFPFDDAVRKPQAEFDDYLQREIARRHDTNDDATADTEACHASESEAFTLVSDSASAEIGKDLDAMDISDSGTQQSTRQENKQAESNPFMEGLVSYSKDEGLSHNPEDMMETANNDLAYRSTKDPLVDLFYELEDVVSGPRLVELLPAAWKADSLATLKIIFNARSIHLGKSSRTTLYRCAGWLAQNHPLTLVANLRWLSRPVIEKKARNEDEDDFVIVDDKSDDDPTKHDIRNGVAHGYWKDLVNILAIAANGKLGVLDDPSDVLNSYNPGILRSKGLSKSANRGRRGTAGRGRGRGGQSPRESMIQTKDEKADAAKTRRTPKQLRRENREKRHETASGAFKNDPVYRALHLTTARLFAEQLQQDLGSLRGDNKTKRSISLCGKWAPSHDHFHDRHTFIVSTIAEIMYPRETIDNANLRPTDDRETYLRFAREEYRKDISALRNHLDIVERHITDKKYESIKYDRVPSLAMNQYSNLFIDKDPERFEKYIDKVVEGKSNISGATLLPSTLIQKVRDISRFGTEPTIESKVANGQWNTLVKRIKDSGNLESSIAVCDVSGSMMSPWFKDKTTPLDSAIGLSLIVAEAAKPPFSGTFITFSENPAVERVDLTQSLLEKYSDMKDADWGMSTNFTAVFEDLILPMAIKNKLKQEDMIKRVFVFSDMHFDDASRDSPLALAEQQADDASKPYTSFERIKSKYRNAGYEMPELVFWNLAGGGSSHGDTTAPKPVSSTEEGTCLVSGYSPALLKVFLDGASFEDPGEVVDDKGEGGATDETPEKKAKTDPSKLVKKAIAHKAYDMLKVVD
ncbi:hypothetical protein F66182_2231 [Fusarium sp. NRRL 66182]|nr:hypothetical protein F66182_2231 [Fusarium sp. NRRL 66182]